MPESDSNLCFWLVEIGLIFSEPNTMGGAKQQKAHEEKVFLKNSLLSFLIEAVVFMGWIYFYASYTPVKPKSNKPVLTRMATLKGKNIAHYLSDRIALPIKSYILVVSYGMLSVFRTEFEVVKEGRILHFVSDSWRYVVSK